MLNPEQLARRLTRRLWATGDREDIAQIVRLALWQAEQTFDPARGLVFDAYARRCARNAVVDARRAACGRSGRRPRFVAEVEIATVDREPDETPALAARLALLDDRHRLVVERRLADEPMAGIARELGVSVSRVDQMQRAARRAMRLGISQRKAPPGPAAPTPAPPPAPEIRPLEDVERDAITAALRATGGHVVAAARGLRIGRMTLYRRLRRWRIDPAEFAPR